MFEISMDALYGYQVKTDKKNVQVHSALFKPATKINVDPAVPRGQPCRGIART